MNKKSHSIIQIDKKFDELPEIFKERIFMLEFSLNYSSRKKWNRTKEIEACYLAYQIACQIIIDGSNLNRKRLGLYVKKLAKAYIDFVSINNNAEIYASEVMMVVDDLKIALPRKEYILRYLQAKEELGKIPVFIY